MTTYQIIIAQNGQHFGTVDLKTNSRETAEARFKRLAAKLSPRLGYSLSLTEWTMPVGRDLLRQEAAQ